MPSYLYVTNTQGLSVDIYDANTFAFVSSIPTSAAPFLLAASLDGKTVYCCCNNSNNLYALDVASSSVIKTVTLAGSSSYMELSPDGSTLYVSQNGDPNNSVNTVTFFDTATNAIRHVVSQSEPIWTAVSSDNQTLFVSNYNNNIVSTLNTSTYNAGATYSVPDPNSYGLYGIALSKDNSILYAVNTQYAHTGGSQQPQCVYQINLSTGVTSVLVNLASNTPQSVFRSVDGNSLYVLSINTAM